VRTGSRLRQCASRHGGFAPLPISSIALPTDLTMTACGRESGTKQPIHGRRRFFRRSPGRRVPFSVDLPGGLPQDFGANGGGSTSWNRRVHDGSPCRLERRPGGACSLACAETTLSMRHAQHFSLVPPVAVPLAGEEPLELLLRASQCVPIRLPHRDRHDRLLTFRRSGTARTTMSASGPYAAREHRLTGRPCASPPVIQPTVSRPRGRLTPLADQLAYRRCPPWPRHGRSSANDLLTVVPDCAEARPAQSPELGHSLRRPRVLTSSSAPAGSSTGTTPSFHPACALRRRPLARSAGLSRTPRAPSMSP